MSPLPQMIATSSTKPLTRTHVVKVGKTPVLDPAEARSFSTRSTRRRQSGLRDRALIGLMVYSFARIGAALAMRVEDVYTQNRRLWVRLHEKGGKRHAMPCHHNLEAYLHAYIDGAGSRTIRRRCCFDTISRGTGQLTGDPPAPGERLCDDPAARDRPPTSRRRSATTRFRATGITAYLKNGGTLEKAAPWRTMPRRARRSFTTAGATR